MMRCDEPAEVSWLEVQPSQGTTPPQGSSSVTVNASAADLAPGGYFAWLCAGSNDPARPVAGVPVILSVLPPLLPDLSFDPGSLDFGDLDIGAPGLTLDAVLRNRGESAATGLNFSIPEGFQAETAGCGNTLPAGGECLITVGFDPSEAGLVKDALVAQSDQAAAQLPLAGNGTEDGALGAAPAQLHFEEVVVTRSRTLTFNVHNSADAGANALELSALRVENGGPVFAISRIECGGSMVLGPGQSCEVEVTFATVTVTAHAGTVHIATGDGQKITVGLTGTVLPDEVFGNRFEH